MFLALIAVVLSLPVFLGADGGGERLGASVGALLGLWSLGLGTRKQDREAARWAAAAVLALMSGTGLQALLLGQWP